MQNTNMFKNYLLLLLIALIWGSQFALANIALKSITPTNIAIGRAVIGFLTLTICLRFIPRQVSSGNLPKQSTPWLLFLMIALFESVIPLFLIAWGLDHVDSGIGAILMGTVPIFTMLIATLATKQDKLRWQLVASILLGFGGVVILSLPSIHGASSSILGELAILIGAGSFAISLVLLKSLPPMSPIKQMRDILGLAAIPLIIAGVFINNWSMPSLEGIVALLLLGSFCTGIVYLMFMILIRNTTPTFASLTNYLIPLIGVVIGCIFLNESFNFSELIALIMILGALGVNQLKSRKD